MGKKQASESVNSKLALVMKSGKAVLGFKSTMKALRKGNLKAIFVAANTTILQASQNQTVDIVLATLLLLGSVAGVQIGAKFTNVLKGEHLRLILSTIIILVSLKILTELITIPSDLFSIVIRR